MNLKTAQEIARSPGFESPKLPLKTKQNRSFETCKKRLTLEKGEHGKPTAYCTWVQKHQNEATN
jgi:hypothetical protein